MAAQAATHNGFHHLRLALSCRKITAQVMCPNSDSIIAMASSSEQEFISEYKKKLNRFPRNHFFWDAKTASKVGEKIANRLQEIGISSIRIDAREEMSRPVHYRKMVRPLFNAVKESGIIVSGAEDLVFVG